MIVALKATSEPPRFAAPVVRRGTFTARLHQSEYGRCCHLALAWREAPGGGRTAHRYDVQVLAVHTAEKQIAARERYCLSADPGATRPSSRSLEAGVLLRGRRPKPGS
jgi:hypothetical protein